MGQIDTQDVVTQQDDAPLREGPRLLLASDGSQGATRAADTVAALAEALGAHVIVATVATAHDSALTPWDSTEEHPIPTASAAEWAHGDAERLRRRGIDVSEIVLEGHPADALIAEAGLCSAEVIVIGRHGADHQVSPFPGSLVEELARRSPLPVLVVP